MPWKIGGNFEIVATKCKANWKECMIAIVNYIWCEMVSDVVDYLGKEGMIWILIVIITSTILLRVKYHKKTRMQKVVLNKQILSKVGYKIHDLELKINVLTYKMQYGTWPLPHQIYSLNPKKLQKIKMTLSNPGDYKSWINHVLLSPMKNSMCVPYPNIFGPSEVKLTDFSDIKGKRTRHVEYNGLTDCSSIEMSKSTSDQSVNSHSQAADMYSQNASTRESDCSKSENFTLPQQNTRFQPSVPNEIEGRFSKTSLTEKHVTPSMLNAKCSPYQFTDIVHKCKSFLKELQCNDRHLHLSQSSSKTSNTCPLKQSIASFATQNENASHDNQVTTIKKEINETRCAKEINNSETIENGEETYRPNAVISTSNDNATFSKETIQSVCNVQSSQETLHEVKRKLQSLHNVLQAYQDASRSSEQEESKRNERLDEIDASIMPIEIEDADRCKTDTNCNVDSQKNPRELQHWMDNCEYFDHSGGFSLSSLTECSSNTSKAYWCPSNDATRHSCSKESNHCAAHRSVERPSDLPTSSMATKLSDCEQSSRFYSFSTLRISEDCTNCEDEYEEDACRRNVSDHTRKSDAHAKINENVTNANSSFHLERKISDTVSERICCILSPRSFKDKNTQTQNGISSRSVEIFDNGEQRRQENAIVSQSDNQMSEKCQRNAMSQMSQSGDRTSNSNDGKEKSTALLLQEALHFKKILLTQIDSAQGQPTQQGTNENDIANHESSREYKKTQQRENNDDFPSMMLDIKTEEPVIEDSCEQTNQHYIYLEMKQRRDSFLRSKELNTLARHESEEKSQDRSCEQSSSKYFSVPDVAIRNDNNDDNVKIESNVLSSLKPPIYEKMISIMIPIDVRRRDEIEIAKNKNEKSLQTNDAVAGYIWTRTNSVEDFRGNRSVDDNIIGRLPMTRKFEDLVLERIRNIRDYMDTFLRNQNEAISKVRRALLQYHGESDAMLALRCSNETSHVMLHKHLIAISSRDNCIDQAISLSNDSSDSLLKAWPNCRSHEVLLDDDILKYCSSICLRKNPEMFALIAPIKSEFSDKSDVQSPETTAKLEKKETDSSMIFKHSCEKDAKLTHKITNLDEPYQENQEKNQVNKQMIADTQKTNSQKHQHQREMQDAENKSSAISSRYSLGAETDTKIIEITRKKLPAISNNNSTSNSSSYFTTATVSSMKMDDVFSKSTLNSEQSVSIVQNKTKQNQTISKENNFVEKSPNMNVEKGELSSNLEYSSLKTLVDSNFVSGESKCDFSTSARTMLNENDISYDSGMSPLLSSLNVKEKTLKTENSSLSSEIFVNVAHSAETEAHSTKQSSQTYPQIKAKSDVSLTANRRTDLNVNLYPKRSLSFLTRHDSLAHIQRTLHQSHIKVVHVQHDNKDKFAENKLQFMNRSKSVVPSQRISTKSCIPISKNRLEPIRRVRHQTHARSPTRGPLTVSCREKTFSKTEDEKITQKRSIPIINRHLHVKEMALDLIESDMQKDTFAKDLERIDKADTAYRDSDATSQENSKLLANELANTNSSAIERECSKKFTDGNKSDMKIIERENATHKTIAIISIMADEDVRKNYPMNSFILKTEKICSATDFLRHNNKLWAVTIEKTEKEVTAKPSITDTCTSMTEVVLKTN